MRKENVENHAGDVEALNFTGPIRRCMDNDLFNTRVFISGLRVLAEVNR
jgi:hypothetical protein